MLEKDKYVVMVEGIHILLVRETVTRMDNEELNWANVLIRVELQICQILLSWNRGSWLRWVGLEIYRLQKEKW